MSIRTFYYPTYYFVATSDNRSGAWPLKSDGLADAKQEARRLFARKDMRALDELMLAALSRCVGYRELAEQEGWRC